MREEEEEEEAEKKLPKTSSGYGRPCDHHRRVPAVRSSDPVHPQTLGLPVVAQRQVFTVHALHLQVQFLDRFLTCLLWYYDRCLV